MKYKVKIIDKNKDKLSRIRAEKAFSIISLVLMILEGVLSAAFAVMIIDFNVLPFKYILVMAAAIIGIFAGIFFLRRKGFVRQIIASAVSLLLCFIFAVGCYYVYITNRTIDTITGEGYNITIYKASVKVDDPAENIGDAADYTFGTYSGYSADTFNEAMAMFADKAGKELKTVDYGGIDKLLNAWYDGEVDGMIYESTLGGIFDDLTDTYYMDAKIIDEVSIKKPKSELPIQPTVPETTTEAETETETETESETETAVKESIDEPFVVLISGSDEYFEVSLTGRSDVNMLVIVNFNERQVLLVSTPRDYYVPFPGVTGDSKDKLTHAGIYGIDVLSSTIEQLYGVDIDYYVRVNFTSVVDIIDAIGGLAFYNPYAFGTTYYDYWFNEGEIWVDGWIALQYARERKSLPDGDLARGLHQQIVIEAMINKLVSAASIANYSALMDAVDNCAITDMPKELIKKIVKIQLDEGGSWNILKLQANGYPDFQPSFASDGMELSVIVPEQDSIDYVSQIIQRVYNGEILTQEEIDGTSSEGDIAEEDTASFEAESEIPESDETATENENTAETDTANTDQTDESVTEDTSD